MDDIERSVQQQNTEGEIHLEDTMLELMRFRSTRQRERLYVCSFTMID
jgi:hypothetical protein